jgi:hypothetical protein
VDEDEFDNGSLPIVLDHKKSPILRLRDSSRWKKKDALNKMKAMKNLQKGSRGLLYNNKGSVVNVTSSGKISYSKLF